MIKALTLEKQKKRGVKTRAILHVEENELPKKRTVDDQKSFTGTQYIYSTTLFGMHIFDRKEVTFNISEDESLPCLWSNDLHVLEMANVYFESLWQKQIIFHTLAAI